MNDLTIRATAFTGTGDLDPITCGTPALGNGQPSLSPGHATTCTATYIVTADDIAAGRIDNTAIATATSVIIPGQRSSTLVQSGPSSTTVTTRGTAAITITKSSPTTVIDRVHEHVSLSYVVTNTGTLALSQIRVTDVPTPPATEPITVTCPHQPNGAITLQPRDSTTCTGTYTISQADYDHGSVRAVATATGIRPDGVTVSDDATLTIPVKDRHSLPTTGGSHQLTWVIGGVTTLLVGAALVLLTRRRRQTTTD